MHAGRPRAGTFTTAAVATTASPGFVQILVSVGDSATALGAAAIEPHQIATALPPPDDFGVFWAEKKAQLAAVPVNLRMQPVPTERRGVEVFDVQADSCVGNGVSAYLARLAMGGRVI